MQISITKEAGVWYARDEKGRSLDHHMSAGNLYLMVKERYKGDKIRVRSADIGPNTVLAFGPWTDLIPGR